MKYLLMALVVLAGCTSGEVVGDGDRGYLPKGARLLASDQELQDLVGPLAGSDIIMAMATPTGATAEPVSTAAEVKATKKFVVKDAATMAESVGTAFGEGYAGAYAEVNGMAYGESEKKTVAEYIAMASTETPAVSVVERPHKPFSEKEARAAAETAHVPFTERFVTAYAQVNHMRFTESQLAAVREACHSTTVEASMPASAETELASTAEVPHHPVLERNAKMFLEIIHQVEVVFAPVPGADSWEWVVRKGTADGWGDLVELKIPKGIQLETLPPFTPCMPMRKEFVGGEGKSEFAKALRGSLTRNNDCNFSVIYVPVPGVLGAAETKMSPRGMPVLGSMPFAALLEIEVYGSREFDPNWINFYGPASTSGRGAVQAMFKAERSDGVRVYWVLLEKEMVSMVKDKSMQISFHLLDSRLPDGNPGKYLGLTPEMLSAQGMRRDGSVQHVNHFRSLDPEVAFYLEARTRGCCLGLGNKDEVRPPFACRIDGPDSIPATARGTAPVATPIEQDSPALPKKIEAPKSTTPPTPAAPASPRDRARGA